MTKDNVEVHYLSKITSTTPNSVFPVMVYRNVLTSNMTDLSLSEKERQNNVDEMFKANGWKILDTFASTTVTHYHPNVHEVYGVIRGSSTLILGLDVNITPSTLSQEEFSDLTDCIKVTMNLGDVIVIPAGVSHCSKVNSKDYRYVAAYPMDSSKYISVNKIYTKNRSQNGIYDNTDDIEMSIKALFPEGDPVYGKEPGMLFDIWTKQLQVS